MQIRRINPQQRRWSTPVVAALTSVAVVAAAAFGGHTILKTQDIGSGPIDASVQQASFAEGATTVVDDAAIATQGDAPGPKAVKEFHRDQVFSQFALTWTGERDVPAYVRAKQADGSWSQWYQTQPLGTEGMGGKTGTELIYIGSTNDIQVSVGNVDMTADAAAAAATGTAGATLPSDLDVVFIDGNASQDQQGGIAPVAESYATNAPQVVSRAGWGANESIRCQGPDYDDGDKAIVLHHTAGSNDYSPAQAAAQVRGIYQYHAQTLGWCDIGYNVLVDKYGTIYEGRYGGLDKAVQGAHVGGFNSNTWGVSMIGNYSTDTPSASLKQSVAEISGWKAAISGFAPQATTSLRSGGFNGSRFPAGSTYTGPAFLSHKDLHFTECPGNNTDVAEIRQMAQTSYEKYKDSAGPIAPSDNGGSTGGGSGSPLGDGIDPNVMSSIGDKQIPMSTITALAGIAASVLGIALAIGTKTGHSTDLKSANVGGVTLQEASGIAGKVVALTGNEGLSGSWTAILNAFGPVLGLAVGGPDLHDINTQLISQLFSNGVVLSTKDTGTHALVGEVAKKWAENPQSLGLPISDEYPTGDPANTMRIDFQGGFITIDPATGQATVFTN